MDPLEATIGLFDVLKGVAFLIITIIAWVVNRMVKSIDQVTERVSDLEKHQPNAATKGQIDVMRDKMEANQKEMYAHHDREADKIRNDINHMAEGLRSEMNTINSSVGQVTGALIQLTDTVGKLNSTVMKHLDKEPND